MPTDRELAWENQTDHADMTPLNEAAFLAEIARLKAERRQAIDALRELRKRVESYGLLPRIVADLDAILVKLGETKP